MNTKLLVDAIVRQTTIVIAQLCTAAGVRAPLAQVADQVFLGLAREIEAQGVGRKVAADMFGLALRSYQKKVQRLTESASAPQRTLWEALLDFLRDHGSVPRHRIFERFCRDDEEAVAAVLADLVGSGLAYATGRGSSALYGLTSAEDRQRLIGEETLESTEAMVWLTIYREGPVEQEAIAASLGLPGPAVSVAVEALLREGRVERCSETDRLESRRVSIAVGDRAGWEAAVFDHYQALCKAIAAKVRMAPQSREADVIGGATLSFHVYPGHPHEQEVQSLLQRTRAELNALWQRVASHNQAHPAPAEGRTRVTFYFGQNVEITECDPAPASSEAEKGP